MMIPEKEIQSPCDILLDRHGIIEASAGTGKTYTIENLFLLILLRTNTRVEEILTVTYTEKAAGEMKLRIRENMESVLAVLEAGGKPGLLTENCDAALFPPESEIVEKIQTALDEFDRASIFTIHGFCHGLLQRYGFEMGRSFETDLSNDSILGESLLKDILRKEQARLDPDDLGLILEFSSFPAFDYDGSPGWFHSILEAAVLPLEEHRYVRLFPDDAPDPSEGLFHKVKGELNKILKLARSLPGNPESIEAYLETLGPSLNGRSRNSILGHLRNYLIRLPQILEKARYDTPSNFFDLLVQLCDLQYSAYKTDGFQAIRSKMIEEENPAPELEAYFLSLESLQREIDTAVAIYRSQIAKQLHTLLGQEKKKRGVVSYDDMLLQVSGALEHRDFLLSVRGEFRYGIVDEFQDTDKIQWNIFRNIFLDSQDHTLFLVGDPKQSIYAFRGADVNAYILAKNEITSERGKGISYRLSTNYRTRPALLHSFNEIFAADNWFGNETKDSKQIRYTPVHAARKGFRKTELARDDGIPGFRAVQLSAGGVQGKKEFARFIAKEIRRLIRSDLRFCEKNTERQPDPGDVAILVKTRADGEILERALQEEGLPHSFYKKPGFYFSKEAMEMEWLLTALESPGDERAIGRVLISGFFRVSPRDLDRYSNLPPDHPFKSRLFSWRELARKRKWPLFFQTVFNDSQILLAKPNEESFERRVANFHHLREDLEQAALAEGLNLSGLLRLLRFRLSGDAELAEESTLHRKETSSRRIQILTMHASKGLEFPIVFLFAGITQRRNESGSFLKYHSPATESDASGEETLLHFHFDKNENGQRIRKEETIQEEKRLFYVAFTRARILFYLPWLPEEQKNDSRIPLADYLRDSIRPAMQNTSLESVLLSTGKATAGIPGFSDPDLVSCSQSESRAVSRKKLATGISTDISLPENLEGRSSRLDSYSSIARRLKREESFGEDESGRDRDALESLPIGPGDLIRDYLKGRSAKTETEKKDKKENDPLPLGARSGDLVHWVFENIDFSDYKNRKRKSARFSDSFQEKVLKKKDEFHVPVQTGVSETQLIERLEELIANTLTTELILPETETSPPFRLSRLSAKDRVHELDFYFKPTDTDASGNRVWLMGFIDLIFQYEGKYYIADWKSNTLPDYSPENLIEAMNHAGYEDQYLIYTAALVRYLESLFDTFSYEEQFGGVFYFFVRGMNPDTPEKGVFFTKPDWSRIEERLNRIYGNTIGGETK